MNSPLHPSPLKRRRIEQLRVRAVLYEALRHGTRFRRDWSASPAPRALPPLLTPQQALTSPFLLQVRALGKEPRCEASRPDAFNRQLDQLAVRHGDLVLLTMQLPHLDDHSLYWGADRQALVSESKKALTSLLGVKGKGVRSMLTVIERGLSGGTHSHSVTHLDGLCARYRAALLEAPRGQGGGTELEAGLHGVIVDDTPQDRARLARYLRKHPDGRCKLSPGHDLHVAMLEEIAHHMVCGADDPSVHLVWRLPQGWKPGRRLR